MIFLYKAKKGVHTMLKSRTNNIIISIIDTIIIIVSCLSVSLFI